ncbi:MAG: hypothetical protein RLZZ200_2560 [Pseudomonadota bacterium]|jgi:glycosyltransferase involved in cell wall biosynthesis
MSNPVRIVYVVHSGQAFGTERVALATLRALRSHGDPLFVAPPGPAHALAASQGVESVEFRSLRDLFGILRGALSVRGSALFTTGLTHTLCAAVLRVMRPGRFRELHVVHGGTDEALSYGRKHLVAKLGVRLIAISDFVRQRLIAHGVPEKAIAIVPNFLETEGAPPPRAASDRQLQRVLVVSRADRIKRLELLIDAVRLRPSLGALQIDVLGSGELLDDLRKGSQDLPNLHFHGYVDNVPDWLAQADLLVHTCPTEPFGLAVLEAFRAGVPVLVPDCGGTGELVRANEDGWQYKGGDARALAEALANIAALTPAQRAAVAEAAGRTLRRDYSPESIAPVLWRQLTV